MATTAETLRPRTNGQRQDDVRVLGPDVDGGVRLSMSGRLLFSNMDRVPERTARVVAVSDGVGRMRGRLLPVAVVADPGLARTILTRPAGFGQGRGIDALALTFGQGLLTSSGELHRRQRRLVQPAFHARRLAAYARDAVQLAATRSAAWHDGERIDVLPAMSTLTFEFVGRTLFGTDVSDEVAVVSDAQHHLLALFPTLMCLQGMLAARWPTPLRRRLRRQVARLDEVVERVIAARRESGDTGDVVSMLLAVRGVSSEARWLPFGGSVEAPALLIGEMTVGGS
jgi:cytochrome P450